MEGECVNIGRVPSLSPSLEFVSDWIGWRSIGWLDGCRSEHGGTVLHFIRLDRLFLWAGLD